MAVVRIRLLSGFELTVDGAQITLQPAVQRLVAFVALAPRGVARDFAAFQLWPDTDEERAKANLRSTLWRLRVLPLEIIAASKARLQLAHHIWVDARHGIEELAAGGEGGVLDDVLPFHAFHGDLLPDWYDEWLVIERERLRQLKLRALEARAREALAAGDTADAIQTGLAAVSIDPLRESGRRLVIEAHLAEGNTMEAVREFDRYRACTGSGTGLAPSATLASLLGGLGVSV